MKNIVNNYSSIEQLTNQYLNKQKSTDKKIRISLILREIQYLMWTRMVILLQARDQTDRQCTRIKEGL